MGDLLKIRKKRREGLEDTEADLELEAYVGSLLTNTLQNRWIYLEEQWYESKNNSWSIPPRWAYEILNEIEGEILRIETVFLRSQKRRMSSQHFLKVVEECLRRFLEQTRTEVWGSLSLTGFLFQRGRSTRPNPSWVCTSYANIELELCSPLTSIQKRFLLTLMVDDDPFKVNLLWVFLHQVFSLDTREQYGLFLWGPGATGKSTLTQLLKYILGDTCEKLKVGLLCRLHIFWTLSPLLQDF